jgi:Flp pilus assembly protein protease CpaA
MSLEPAILATVVVSAIAAFTDLRGGVIPNWLTLPPLVVAPAVSSRLSGLNSIRVTIRSSLYTQSLESLKNDFSAEASL